MHPDVHHVVVLNVLRSSALQECTCCRVSSVSVGTRYGEAYDEHVLFLCVWEQAGGGGQTL